MGGKADEKQADLAKNTKAPTTKDVLTSDAGVKQTNTDDWLKVVNDNHTGSELLEDPFSREKVTTASLRPISFARNANSSNPFRYTGLTMRGSRRESSTRGEAVRLERSGFSRVRRM